MTRQTNTIVGSGFEARANRHWDLVIAAVAGVALVAVGCSTYHHAPADSSSSKTTYEASTGPAPSGAGAAETPRGQSIGYSTSTTVINPIPPPPKSIVVVDHPVNFNHMRVERVVNDREIEVSSDDGRRFYVICDQTTSDLKQGDIVFVSSKSHDPNSVSTAIDKKGAFYLTPRQYWIQVDRLTIIQR